MTMSLSCHTIIYNKHLFIIHINVFFLCVFVVQFKCPDMLTLKCFLCLIHKWTSKIILVKLDKLWAMKHNKNYLIELNFQYHIKRMFHKCPVNSVISNLASIVFWLVVVIAKIIIGVSRKVEILNKQNWMIWNNDFV